MTGAYILKICRRVSACFDPPPKKKKSFFHSKLLSYNYIIKSGRFMSKWKVKLIFLGA